MADNGKLNIYPRPKGARVDRETFTRLVLWLQPQAESLSRRELKLQELHRICADKGGFVIAAQAVADAARMAGVKIVRPSPPPADVQSRVVIRQALIEIRNVMISVIGVAPEEVAGLTELIGELPETVHPRKSPEGK